MGVLHVRSEVAFRRGLWLRMKAMQKEPGNGGMILLEGYDMVDQWSFAGDVNANEETIRCEKGECRNDGWSTVPVIIEHGAPRILRKSITVKCIVRGVVRWRERRQCVAVRGGTLVQDDTSHVVSIIVNGTELRKRQHDENKSWS
jgi:hypothetical protein